MAKKPKPKVGDLRVWWCPQIPCPSFKVAVASVEEGAKLMDTLALYDDFQFRNRIKPDYSSAGGLQVYCDGCGEDGGPGWCDWYDDETGEDDPRKWLEGRGLPNEPLRSAD